MSTTYYVAHPFLKTDDGIATGEAQEMPSAAAAVRRQSDVSRSPQCGRASFQTLWRSEPR
jgi:hypothetical protein